MRRFLAPFLFCLSAAMALAGGNTSVYTKFDFDTCRVIEKGDEFTYAGTWACEGYQGIDIVQASSDDRSYVGFGSNGRTHCAFAKTFFPLNSALSPIEWRLKNEKLIAAIERWSMVIDEAGNSSTWLVVNAIRPDQSCHVHYVAGSYPDANAQARRAADDLAEDFDCANDVPTVDSKAGPPPIALKTCRELGTE